MSLIGDALKEGSRERPARTAPRSTKPLGEFVVPTSRARSRGRGRIGRLLVLGFAAGAIAGAGGYLGLRFQKAPPPRRTQVPPAPVVAPVASPVVPPPALVTVPVASTPPSTPPQASTAATSPVPVPTPAPTVVAHEAPREPQPVKPVVDSAVKPQSKAQAPASAPAPKVMAVEQFARPTTFPTVATPSNAKPSAPSSPNHAADSLFRLAYATHMRGDLANAAELYEKTLATKVASSVVYNDYGVLLKQRDEGDRALKMFRQAIDLDNTNVEAWVNLGDALQASGEHAEALSSFARASQLDPSRVAIKTRLATEYQATGDTATAREFFETSLKLEPKNPASHYAFATFLQSQREFAAAMREYERFIDLAADTYPASALAEVRQHILALKQLTP